MAFKVTNDFVGDTAPTAAKLDTNFADIESLVNAGLTTANLASGAAITNTQLANSKYEFCVNLCLTKAQWTLASSTSTPALVVAIPGTSDTYTVKSLSWWITDCGSQDGTISVQWGSYTGASAIWTSSGSGEGIIKAITLSKGEATDNTPIADIVTSFTTSSLVQHSFNQRFIGLLITAKGTSTMGTDTDIMGVTLRIQRASGLTA